MTWWRRLMVNVGRTEVSPQTVSIIQQRFNTVD